MKRISYCCCCLVTMSCLTLCNAMHCSPPGSSVHGISQARILEWIAISFSKGSSQGSNIHFLHWQADSLPLCHLGRPYKSMLLPQFVIPYPSLTVSTSLFSMSVSLFLPCKQALLSMRFSRQEYWNGLPFQCPLCERESTSRSVVSDSLQSLGL